MRFVAVVLLGVFVGVSAVQADHGEWPRPPGAVALEQLCEQLGTPVSACVIHQQDAVLQLIAEEEAMHHPDRRLMDRCMHRFDNRQMDYVALLACYRAAHGNFDKRKQ